MAFFLLGVHFPVAALDERDAAEVLRVDRSDLSLQLEQARAKILKSCKSGVQNTICSVLHLFLATLCSSFLLKKLDFYWTT